MNISSELSLIDEYNTSGYFINDTVTLDTDFEVFSVIYLTSVLVGFPTNCFVIWLIVSGTGNGIAAEFFSLNLSICELIFCLISLFCYLSLSKAPSLLGVVFFLDGFPTTSRPLFQCLICVERYLAVVHPVTFLKFKPLRYRVMCTVIVWVAGFGSCVIMYTLWVRSLTLLYVVVYLMQYFVFFLIQLFCCLAVLRALKQSGPGERGREREENHMKRRAFNFILIITLTTVIIYPLYFISILIYLTIQKNLILMCVGVVCFCFAVMVHPLVFLHRVGKLPFIMCQ